MRALFPSLPPSPSPSASTGLVLFAAKLQKNPVLSAEPTKSVAEGDARGAHADEKKVRRPVLEPLHRLDTFGAYAVLLNCSNDIPERVERGNVRTSATPSPGLGEARKGGRKSTQAPFWRRACVDEGMAFFLSAPREFAAGARDEEVLSLEFDRTQKYLAVLTRSSLSIWGGKADRLLLAQHSRADINNGQEGNVALVWSPGSTEIAVLEADGGLIYYSLIKQLPSYSLPVLLADPAYAESVSLQLRQHVRADDHFLASITRDGRAIVCGTSDGQLVRISWSGVVTALLTITDGAKYTVASERESSTAGTGGYSTAPAWALPQTPFLFSSPKPSQRDAAGAEREGLPPPEDVRDLRRQVREFYLVHNPQKLRESPSDFVETTVEKWRGREHLLLPSLHRKYSVPMSSDVAAELELAPEVSRLSMRDVERSQPATLAIVRACSQIGMYACARIDGGVFLVPHSNQASLDAASQQTAEPASPPSALEPAAPGGGESHIEHAVAVRTWIPPSVGAGRVRVEAGKSSTARRRATCLVWGRVYSATDALLSVGYNDGRVVCLLVKTPELAAFASAPVHASVTTEVVRVLDLASTAHFSGPLSVVGLGWDRAGECLACLYVGPGIVGGGAGGEISGCVLWSAFGNVTGSTLPGGDDDDDECCAGVRPQLDHKGRGAASTGFSLAWSGDGYRLVTAESGARGRFRELQMCRPRFDRGIGKGGAECLILQAEDRILMLRRGALGSAPSQDASGGGGEAEEGQAQRVGGESFDHILLPAEYYEAHGSVRLACVNASGDLAAVASDRGVCVYNRCLGRWKMFGDVTQEKAFCCSAMRWWRQDRLVLLVCPAGSTGGDLGWLGGSLESDEWAGHSILVLSTDKLDLDKALFATPLPSRPVAMDVEGDYILIMDEACVVALFYIPAGTPQRASSAASSTIYAPSSASQHESSSSSSLNSTHDTLSASSGNSERGDKQKGGWLSSLLGWAEGGGGRLWGGGEQEKMCRRVSSLKISGPTPPLAVSIISVGGGGDDSVEWEEGREAAVSLVHFANGDLVLVSERPGSSAQVQVLSEGVLNVHLVPNLLRLESTGCLLTGKWHGTGHETDGALIQDTTYDMLLWIVTAEGLRLMALSLCGEHKLAVIENVLNTLGEYAKEGRQLNHLDLDASALPMSLGPGREGHYLAAVVCSRQLIRGPFARMAQGPAGPAARMAWVHGVAIRAQPLLHFVLAHLMVRYGTKVAARLAQSLDRRHGRECGRESGGRAGAGQWAYSAELLVFLALDREISRNAIEGARVADVLEVLAGLSVFAQAVGSCARKVESKYWPLLFPRGDEPQALIRSCLSCSPPRPNLASIFLVIIQATAGPAGAVEAAAPVLAVALHLGSCSLSYELAAQIVGFIQRSEEASQLERQQQQQQHDYASWFPLASLYASSDAAHAVGKQEQRRQHAAEVPLAASCREVLRTHLAALVASCNLRALAALISALGDCNCLPRPPGMRLSRHALSFLTTPSLVPAPAAFYLPPSVCHPACLDSTCYMALYANSGPEVLVRSCPPFSFALPAIAPPPGRPPPVSTAQPASIYETRTVGMPSQVRTQVQEPGLKCDSWRGRRLTWLRACPPPPCLALADASATAATWALAV